MIFGIPSEVQKYESRVSIAPDTVKKLVKSGHEVLIQSDAGLSSSFINKMYTDSGAKITDDKKILVIIEQAKELINQLYGPVPDDKGRLPDHPHHGHNH